MVEKSSKLVLALFAFFIPTVSVNAETPCQRLRYGDGEYTVCEVDLRRQSVRLFWKKPDGRPYGYPSSLPKTSNDSSTHLLFATNGGMYHEDNSPVGLYVEGGRELVRANTNSGPGNFHMPTQWTIDELNKLQKRGKPVDYMVYPDADHGILRVEKQPNGKHRVLGYEPDYFKLQLDWLRRSGGSQQAANE